MRNKNINLNWFRKGDVYETNTAITPTISRIRYFNSDLVDSKFLRVKVIKKTRMISSIQAKLNKSYRQTKIDKYKVTMIQNSKIFRSLNKND